MRARRGAGMPTPGKKRYRPKIGGLISALIHPAMSKPKSTAPASYEAALEELEQLTSLIESGQMPLDQLLAGYQRGAMLLAFCRDRLDAVQDQIQVLDEGVLQPWVQ